MSNTSYCQACRRPAAVKYCEFTQGIGMLVLRSRRGVKGQLCRDCASKYFWELNSLTLLTGWWGMISFVMNIVYIVSNVSYFIGSRGLPSPGGAAFPVQPNTPAPGAGPGQTFTQSSSPANPPPQPMAPGQLPGHPLASYRQDIILRLRGGQTQPQVAQYIATQSGIPAADVQKYMADMLEGRA